MEWNVGKNNSKKYKIKAICNNVVYTIKLIDYLLELYHLVF